MERKSPTIQQGKVTELMTQIANLPEREKAPNDPVSLAEIFRTKEYMAEIRRALKRGYRFGDLAEIFTERCGIVVSARQIKYHLTRAKNQDVKGKPRKKSGDNSTAGNHALSADSQRNTASECVKENIIAPDSRTKPSSNVSGLAFESSAAAGTEGNADFAAFPIDVSPKES